MKRYLESIAQISLAIWVGAMAGFAFVAPQLFAAFGAERQRAGDLAGAMIWRINTLGLILGTLALLTLLPRLRQRLNRWRAGILAGALALSLVGAFYIFPQMDRAKPSAPIETLAEDDPVRVNYNRWHKLSERVFGFAILLGAGTIVLGPLVREETR